MNGNDSLPCPGCHTALPPEATGCQICMRPRTRQEIMRGYAKLRDDKARKRRRPFQILAAVLVLAGGGKLYMSYGGRLTAAAVSAGRAIGRWTDDMRNPSHYAMKSPQAQPTAEPPAAPGAPVAPESAMRSQIFPDADLQAAAAAPGQPPAARPAGSKPLAKNAWRVSGTVYDLATLDPVPGAEVTFLLEGSEPQSATTDPSGSYEIDLPKGDGWTVDLEAPDRRRGQILDIDPSYRVRDADERRAVLANVTDGDLVPAPVGWKRSSAKVRLDLIAVPNRWTDGSPP